MTALTIEQRRCAVALQNGLNRPDTDAKRYSHLEVEAALCVWEFLTEQQGVDGSFADELTEYREGVGTSELRSGVPPIAAWCLRVYEAMTPDEVGGVSYDWDIIPAMVKRVRFGNHKPRLPDIVLTAQAVAEELNPRRPDTPDA